MGTEPTPAHIPLKESIKASQAKSSSAAARMPLLDKAAGRARKRESLARDRRTTLQEADGMRSSEDDLSSLKEELTTEGE